MACPLT